MNTQQQAIIEIKQQVIRDGGEKYFVCSFCLNKVTLTERFVECFNGSDGLCHSQGCLGPLEIISEDEYYGP